jgi:hypothetical protein
MSDIKTEGFGLVDISTHIFPEKILIRSNDTNEDFSEILLTAKINAN